MTHEEWNDEPPPKGDGTCNDDLLSIVTLTFGTWVGLFVAMALAGAVVGFMLGRWSV